MGDWSKPRCWAWPQIEAMAIGGPFSVGMAALELYGAADLHGLQAAHNLLGRLAETRRNESYAGGPYLKRVKIGWYAALDDPTPPVTIATASRLLRRRAYTVEGLMRSTGACERLVVKWLRQFRVEGRLRQERAPAWQQSMGPKGGGPRNWYWIGGGKARTTRTWKENRDPAEWATWVARQRERQRANRARKAG